MKRIFASPADLLDQAWPSSTTPPLPDSFLFGDAEITTPEQASSDPPPPSFHFSDHTAHASPALPFPVDDDAFKFSSTFDHHDPDPSATDADDDETSTHAAPSAGASFASGAGESHDTAPEDAMPSLPNGPQASSQFAGLTPDQFASPPAPIAAHQACNTPGGQPGQHLVLVDGDHHVVIAPSGADTGGTPGGGTTPAVGGTSASPFVINIIYDSSVSNAPAGFMTAVSAAVQYLESQFTDAVTININVGYGEVGGQALDPGALGESLTYLSSYSYSQVRSALIADAKSADDASATATLPASSPVSGTYWASTAEAKALGLSGPSGSLDGYVGFAAGNLFDYDSSNGISGSQYDFAGVFAHEVTEVMGRSLLVGDSIGGPGHGYYPLDLLHYSASGTRDFVGTQAGYFSLDGGATNLNNFNTNPGGDFGDWASSAGNDSFNAFSSPGVVNAVTATDIRVMDAIGWDHASGGSSSPPPATPDLTVSGFALSGNTVSYDVNNGGTAAAAASTTGVYLSTDSTITTGDTLIATTLAGSLAAGAFDAESTVLTWPSNLAVGTYYLGALADNGGQVAESNEGNNASAAVKIIIGNASNNAMTGTANADTMFGLAGNDTLNGAGGADNMSGGTGNDIYVVDNVGDVVNEDPNEGTDTVRSSVSYTLSANVEKLTLTGSAAIDGTGNDLNNVITGNSGSNIIDGGAGADTMSGGAGNDTYIVDDAGDLITEGSNAGIDTVQSSISYTLGTNVENLTLTGPAAIDGTGNSLKNAIIGNSNDNVLNGRLGNDQLTGGGGADQFVFNTAIKGNVDTITDFSQLEGDTIDLSHLIFTKLATSVGSPLGPTEFYASANGAAHASADHILYNTTTGALSYDADGTGSAAAVQFAVLTNHPALVASDFLIV